MTDIIPAQPGWYLYETDGHVEVFDPIIGWKAVVDAEGEDVLLPYVSGGTGTPTVLMDIECFQYLKRRVVYRPSHDPETS